MFWVGDITINSKRFAVLIAAVLLFSANTFLFSQETDKEQKNEISQTQEQDIRITDESQIILGGAENNTPVTNGPSAIWIFVRMIIVLILVIIVIYFIFKLMKKNITPGDDNDPFLRKVSSVNLGTGKSVQVVTLQEKAYIIGVSENSINLLGTIDGKASEDDQEFINALNLYADKQENVKRPRSFADILDLFMPNGPRNFTPEKKKNKNIFSENADQIVDMLEKQRNRLNEETEQ